MMLTLMETFSAIAFAVGPVIGGFLLQLTRFIYTFLTIGIVSLILGTLMLFSLTSDKTSVDDKNTKWLSYVCSYKVIFSLFVIVNGLFQISFFVNILPLHLMQFQITPVAYGGIYFGMATFYAIATVFWSHLVETNLFLEPYIAVIGSVCSSCLLLFVAPSTFVNISPNNPLILTFILILYYVALSTFAVQFVKLNIYVTEQGLSVNIATKSMVSSLALMAMTIGLVIGPPISGYLYEFQGFASSTTIFAFIQLIISFISLFFYVFVFFKKQCINKL